MFSKEPDVVWTGIGKKIPVIVFYASLLDVDIKERQSFTGENFIVIKFIRGYVFLLQVV